MPRSATRSARVPGRFTFGERWPATAISTVAGVEREPSSDTIPQTPDQSKGEMLRGRVWCTVVRVAAAAVFLLYILSGQHDPSSGSFLNHIPNWLRWSFLLCIGCYGWWETSVHMKKAPAAQPASKTKLPNGVGAGPRSVDSRQRISLLAQTPEHLRTLIEGADAYQRRFDVTVAEGLRDFLLGPEVSPEFLERLNGSATADPWKDGFAVLHMADHAVIGLCSFAGPPSVDGTVEIAYGIAPGYQNHGYAREAAQELIAYALASGRVRTIRAHTLPQHNASTRVLTKCGFTLLGEVTHPTDGVVWRWERPLKAETRNPNSEARNNIKCSR
jgi:[ribosomal protein S5]-alanine N-acetyltransferase